MIEAKRRLRPKSGELRLWIDAICINQDDLSERNAQVSVMGRIHQDASSVFAWLDWPDGWDPRLIFGFINILSRDPNASLMMCGSRGVGMRRLLFWELDSSEVWAMADGVEDVQMSILVEKMDFAGAAVGSTSHHHVW